MNPNCFKVLYHGNKVWFILDESYRQSIPTDAIVYTLAEAQILANRSEWAKKIVHEAKKKAGAVVATSAPKSTE